MERSRTRRYYKKTKKITKKVADKLKRNKIKYKKYKTRKNNKLNKAGLSKTEIYRRGLNIRRGYTKPTKSETMASPRIKSKLVQISNLERKKRLDTMVDTLSRFKIPDESAAESADEFADESSDESAAQTEETMRKFDEAKSELNKIDDRLNEIDDRLNARLSSVNTKLEEALKLQKELQSK